MSHFFAYLSRMRFIRRWGLMHSLQTENIQEHSLRVAMIVHALATIRNRLFQGRLNPERLAVLAMYHDASEVLTGDLPRPVKYFNPDIEASYRTIEAVAQDKLLGMVPDALKPDYERLLRHDGLSDDDTALLKAADKLCAYIKCLEELTAGNREFAEAEKTLRRQIDKITLPEVRHFVETFVPSFKLTLDELQ